MDLTTASAEFARALDLAEKGNYSDALQLYQSCLQTRCLLLGHEHPDMATTKNRYAEHSCLHFWLQFLCFCAASVQSTMLKASMMMRSQHGKMCFKFKKKHSAWSTRT